MIISNQYASEPQFDLNKFSVYYPLDSNSNKFYFPLYQENDPKVTIVLSGGGARGLAQIGVLKNFEQSGIAIDNIVGTSIGAFIGGLYSSGYGANQLEQIADTTSWDDLFSISEESRSDYFLDQKEISDRSILRLRFQDFNFIVPDAISTGNQFNDYLNVLFWNSIYHSDNDYDKLKYKFRATATDLVTGQPVILSSGNIIKSIKASGNLPLRNSPVKIDSMLLIDGGIFQNIPTEAAGTFKSDFIILVKTVSPLMKIVELNKPWNIADQVVSIMMKKFEESAEKSADFIITPGLDSIRNTDFQLASKIIGIGSESVDDDLLKGKLETLRHDKIEKHYIDNYQNFSLNNLSADNSMSPDLKNNLEHIINNSAISDTSKFERLIQFAEDNNIKCLFITKDISGKNIISIEEFPVIKRIELNCNSLNLGELENLVNIEYSNARLNENNFKKICENIIGYARQLHFSFALIKNVRFSDGKLTFHVDEGKADIIQIKTKLNAQDYLVFRELKIKQGKDLNLDDIRSSWENLISTDLFSDVNFDFSHNKKDTSVDVTLSIREKGNQMLSFGVYLDNERYLQAGIDLIHYNLFNTGAQFTLRNVGGVRNFGSNISILQQRFLNTMVTARISGYYSYIKRWKFTNDYDLPSNRFASLINGEVIEEAVGIKASAGFQLAKLGNIKIEYRFERQRNYLRDSLKKNPFMTINSISVGTVFDSRDRIDFARRGRFINLSIETSLFRTTSEPTFSRLTFMQVNNFSLGKSTFRPRIIFSIADRTLPFNEFFRIGGENTFYGYSEDEIYGRQVALGSLEYEIKMPFKLLFDTYFSLRYDIGSAWLTPETIKLRNLKNGFGLCLSLDTPIGPARLAGGEAFYFQSNPNGAKFGYPHLYFSIGVRL